MQSIFGTNRNKSGISRHAKGSKQYSSIKEYISELESIGCFISHSILPQTDDWKEDIIQNDINEEEFIEFLEIIDFIIEHRKLDVYNKVSVVDFNSFLDYYDFVLNEIRNIDYYKESKKVITNDKPLSSINMSIMSINMFDVVRAQPYLHKEVWKALVLTCKKVFDKAEKSNVYGYFIDEGYWFLQEQSDYIYDEIISYPNDKDIKENYDNSCKSIRSFEHLRNIKKNLLENCPYKSFDVENIEIDKDQQYLLDIILTIYNHNSNDAYPFISKESYEYFNDEGIEHVRDQINNDDFSFIIDEFYNGMYVLTYETQNQKHDDILEQYVEHVNSKEQETMWLLALSNKVSYTKNTFETSFKKERDNLVNYLEAFSDINEQLKYYAYKLSEKT